MSFKIGHRLNVRHGMSRSPTHMSWTAMMGRCLTPSDGSYANYGGRGITVCDRWRLFENFLADMGERPPFTSIDRVDVNGNYEPGNCRWATDTEQRHNRRITALEQHEPAQIRWLYSLGYRHSEIAAHFGINRELASKVIRNERWSDPEYKFVPRRKSPMA